MQEKNSSENKQEKIYLGNIVSFDVFVVDFFKAFKKFWWTAFIFVLAFSTLAVYKCKRDYVPVYVAKASFSVSAQSSSSSVSGASSYTAYYNAAATAQLSKTFSYIINSQTMRTILLQSLGTNQINGTISASNEVESAPIFTIRVSSTNPQDAYNILEAVMENYPRLAQYVVGETQLKVFSKSQLPQEPSNPLSYKKDVAVACAAGIVLSALIMAFYAVSRNTVRKSSQIKEKLNRSCLVEIPLVKRPRRSKNKNGFLVVSEKYPSFSEAFRYLSRRVTASLDKNGQKSVVFTSAASGEGKTTICYNLAYSIARMGKRVCLIDFDLAKKSLQKSFCSEEKPSGAAEFLGGEASFEEIVKPSELENLKFVFAGTKKVKRKNYSKTAQLVELAKENFDYVLIDSAPCLLASDSAAIFGCSDKTVFVVKQDGVSVSKVRQAMKYIFNSGSDIGGVVLSAVGEGFEGYKDSYSSGYGYQRGRYGYYYGYYGRKKNYGGYNGYGYGYGYGSSSRRYGASYSRRRGYGYGNSYGYGYGYGYGSGYRGTDGGKYVSDAPFESDNAQEEKND